MAYIGRAIKQHPVYGTASHMKHDVFVSRIDEIDLAWGRRHPRGGLTKLDFVTRDENDNRDYYEIPLAMLETYLQDVLRPEADVNPEAKEELEMWEAMIQDVPSEDDYLAVEFF